MKSAKLPYYNAQKCLQYFIWPCRLADGFTGLQEFFYSFCRDVNILAVLSFYFPYHGVQLVRR